MKQNLSKLVRLNRKKGFTMVEIIIVLVIIAILAAAIMPSMLGFVSEARGKAHSAEARVVYVAAQSVATEQCAIDTDTTAAKVMTSTSFENMVADLESIAAAASTTAGVTANVRVKLEGSTSDTADGGPKVEAIAYKADNGNWIKITAGGSVEILGTTAPNLYA